MTDPWGPRHWQQASAEAERVARGSREYLFFILALLTGVIGFVAGWIISPWVWI